MLDRVDMRRIGADVAKALYERARKKELTKIGIDEIRAALRCLPVYQYMSSRDYDRLEEITVRAVVEGAASARI